MAAMPDLDEKPTPPDDHDANWAPAGEQPITVQTTPWAVRFTLLRLIVAITLAPLPFVFFGGRQELATWLFVFAGATLAGVVLLVRAADLPRINFGVGAMLLTVIPAALVLDGFHFFGLAFLMTLVAVPCLFFAHNKYPYYRLSDLRPRNDAILCDRVFETGGVVYLMLNVVAWRQFDYLLQRNHEIVWPAIVTLIVFIALVPFNIALWGKCGTKATLDERPMLGFIFEWALVGIPLLALCLLPRTIWRWW
ncbi:hypothetical protein [Blastopirellula marina]|uniref:Uncharacterized protein n=1 Tax=Blastopirellula marina TaxID=124 RepID=A0A2S8GRA2_9BACT|nr:hypothetical protein [Blastopirellula marina]PQO46953.1 hypothetical protein C5Y93_07325 [Blastopirellula marina]